MTDLINKNPKLDWKIGNTCHFYAPWRKRIIVGMITDTRKEGKARFAGLKYMTETDKPCRSSGRTERPFEALFRTHAEAVAALKEARDNSDKCSDYKAEITDVESLVRFGIDHNICLCGNGVDADAREAYVARAKELLGIEL